jgi:AcrR family transcriptional regulator
MAGEKKSTERYHHGDLRKAIVDTALQLVAESGLANLSLREIARRLGVTTGAPYHHFKDRQALLIEIAIDGYTQLLQALRQAQSQASDAADELRAAASAYLSFGRSFRAKYLVMLSGELVPHPRGDEMMLVADRCLDLVRQSIAHSSELSEAESTEAAFCAWSLLHGILILDSNHVLRENTIEQDRLAIQGVMGIVRGLSRIGHESAG